MTYKLQHQDSNEKRSAGACELRKALNIKDWESTKESPRALRDTADFICYPTHDLLCYPSMFPRFVALNKFLSYGLDCLTRRGISVSGIRLD